MNIAKKIAPSVEDALSELEPWRPALAAFYRTEGSYQSAWNIKHDFPLNHTDERIITAIRNAMEVAP